VINAAERRSAVDRPGDWIDADPEGLLDFADQVERLAPWPVHLVDEREDRHRALLADAKQFFGLCFDAFRTIENHDGAVGGATAIVVGLVVVTPAAGFVSPMSAILLGAIGAVPSWYALMWRARTRLDDSLDVVAAHGLGGATGALLTGVFAEKVWNGATNGLLFGNPGQLAIQAVAVLATLVYSAGATVVLLKLVNLVVPIRATAQDEGLGMDVSQHGEEAYAHGEGAILVLPQRESSLVPILEPSAEGGQA
jgi:ammonia channel protein AmtB